jgi:hypothetical protein
VRSAAVVSVGPNDFEARCHGCGEPLASWGSRRGGDPYTYISLRLMPRPEPHASGLPRYGPSRRPVHGESRHHGERPGVWTTFNNDASLVRIYVNCPECDRGQEVDIR